MYSYELNLFGINFQTGQNEFGLYKLANLSECRGIFALQVKADLSFSPYFVYICCICLYSLICVCICLYVYLNAKARADLSFTPVFLFVADTN